MELPKLTPVVQFCTAAFALAVGGYTAGDKFGWWSTEKPILIWAPDYFKIADTKIGQPINVRVARIKKRDDCSVESFLPVVRDAAGMMHEATPSISRFTGPGGPKVDMFSYQLTLSTKEKVASGRATLTATIKYKCPEGERVVTYPGHDNLTFMLEK